MDKPDGPIAASHSPEQSQSLSQEIWQMFSEPARDILNGQGSIQDYGLLAIEIGVVALAAAPVAVGVDAIGLATALYAVGGGLGIGGGAVAEVANIEEMAKIQS